MRTKVRRIAWILAFAVSIAVIAIFGIRPSPFFLDLPVARAALITDAPSLSVREAYAIENLIVTGDLLVVPRFSLPAVNWDTYGADAALLSLVQSSTTYQLISPPSTGEALAGFYLSPGHGFTFGATATVDFTSNPALFVNNTSSSVSVTSVATTGVVMSSAADQVIVCDTFRSLLQAVEAQSDTDAFGSNDLVSAAIVTEDGTAMAQAAFSAIVAVLPDCFWVGIESGMGEFDPGTPTLRDDLITEVEASAGWTRWMALAGQWGMTGREAEFAAVAGIGGAFAWFLFLMWLTSGKVNYSVTGASMVLLGIGANIPHLLLQVAFVIALVSLVGGAAFYMRQFPR
jgi:hypothetical protein